MELTTQISSFFKSRHMMSLYIDMNVILPLTCSGVHFISLIILCTSARICNVVNPGKFFHSNSIGSPSIRSNSQFSVLVGTLETLPFIFPFNITLWERVYLSKTAIQNLRIPMIFAIENLISSSLNKDSLSIGEVCPQICDTPEISSSCSRISLCDTSNNFFTVGLSSVFLMECKFVQEVSPKEKGCSSWLETQIFT